MPKQQLSPQEFVQKWARTELGERASYQQHFADVCALVGHQTPADKDPTGQEFAYEKGVEKTGGGQGFADVWYDRHFAIEYKAKGRYKDLNAAYQQLLRYRENLNNPPLLVVCDIEHWEIHTNWPGTEKKVYQFTNTDITNPRTYGRIRDMFFAPDKLHPRRNAAEVTAEAAQGFQTIADNMRDWEAEPERIAHFLTKLVFCLFAEDVGLLPAAPRSQTGIFSDVVENTRDNPANFVKYMKDLFNAMAVGGHFMYRDIPYFNGQLFEDLRVEELSYEALLKLEEVANLNWRSVEPSIFGTLFERSLDPSKRAQLGAHYTSRDDILLIVEPVLMQPLRRQWDAIQEQGAPLRQKYDAAKTGRDRQEFQLKLLALRDDMLKQLREVRVLDPACGSGNFLYVALGLLLDLEKAVINHDLFAGLEQVKPDPRVHPRQLFGIEINPIAHALASIVVWIGYIQWRQNNGYFHFTEPILERLQDNIRQMDAILAFDGEGKPVEPEWPEVDVIVGNPPFLGGGRVRGELGDHYVEKLWSLYDKRLPGFSDLVCYWFERARVEIEQNRAQRAGLLATNSIRGGANREVLKRIKDTGDIFMAWSDREWILDGARVRVSMVGFDNAAEDRRVLDGLSASAINPDLTAAVDITTALSLRHNVEICFMGPSPKGPFDIEAQLAQKMIQADSRNEFVVRPVASGIDIARRSRNLWTIDFGLLSFEEARQYSEPFNYLQQHVYPVRSKNRRAAYAERWWQYAEARPGLRAATNSLSRLIVTPTLAKHRVYVWGDPKTLYNQQVISIARSDDYFFGVLHSRLHEVWSLRMGTSLEDRPRYTPTTTFETFPFPWSPGHEPSDDPRYQAIAAAAKQLHTERDAWLNPAGLGEKALKARTLTNLYNALNVWRGKEKMKNIKAAAADFAPRLDELHKALDRAVCDAYGWPHEVLGDEEEMLRRLLALNLARGE